MKKNFLRIIAVLIFIVGIFIFKEINKSIFLKSTNNFDTSFIKKIVLIANGNNYVFDDEQEVTYLRNFFEGNSYHAIDNVVKCQPIYKIDSLTLVGSSEKEKLVLVPTGDDCGFWGPRPNPILFPNEQLSLVGINMPELIKYLETKTSENLVSEDYRKYFDEVINKNEKKK